MMEQLENVPPRGRATSSSGSTGAPMPNASSAQRHTTQPYPAYEPPHAGVPRPWRFLVLGLWLVALASLSLRSVCRPEVPGANERGLGVRHEQRAKSWYHCEPWIRRAIRG